MKKNKVYERPIVLALGKRAASGQVTPLACISGSSVPYMGCSAGSNDTACSSGTGGIIYPEDCVSGAAASSSYSCVSGGTAGYECATGTSATYSGSCTTGPSF